MLFISSLVATHCLQPLPLIANKSRRASFQSPQTIWRHLHYDCSVTEEEYMSMCVQVTLKHASASGDPSTNRHAVIRVGGALIWWRTINTRPRLKQRAVPLLLQERKSLSYSVPVTDKSVAGHCKYATNVGLSLLRPTDRASILLVHSQQEFPDFFDKNLDIFHWSLWIYIYSLHELWEVKA